MTKRLLLTLATIALVAAPLIYLTATATPANATTIGIQNPGSCHIAYTWNSSTSVTMAGDCTTTGLFQQLPPVSSGSPCAAYLNCGYDGSLPITAYEIQGQYEVATNEWVLWQLYVATSAHASDGPYESNHDLCGFNGGTIPIPSYTFTGSGDQHEELTTATATMLANPPTASGGYTNAGGACNAPTSGDNIYLAEEQDTRPGNTGLGTSDYAGVGLANGECTYGGMCPSGAVNQLFPMEIINSTNDLVAPDCTLSDVSGNFTGPTQATGVTYSYSVDYSNAADIVAEDDAYTGTAVTIEGKSFEVPYVFDIDADPSNTGTDTINFEAAVGDEVNPDFWCYSTSTGWVDWGTFAGTLGAGPPGNPPGPPIHASCFSNSGWSWDDPATWVTGALHDGECILQYLFIPTECVGSGGEGNCIDTQTIETDLDNKIPTAYLADAWNAGATIEGGFTSAISTDQCSAPLIAPFSTSTNATLERLSSWSIQLPSPSDLGCSGPGDTSAGNLFGYRTLLRDGETLFVWLTALAVIWRMMPWHRKGDGIDIIDQYGSLNFDGDYVDTYQTNEGSD